MVVLVSDPVLANWPIFGRAIQPKLPDMAEVCFGTEFPPDVFELDRALHCQAAKKKNAYLFFLKQVTYRWITHWNMVMFYSDVKLPEVSFANGYSDIQWFSHLQYFNL